jgi:hypothetical protein
MSTPVPPPQGSPEPKDEVSETPTGKYKALRKEDRVFTTAVAALALLVSLGTLFGTYRLFLSDAKAQTKEQVELGLTAVNLEVKAVKEEQVAAKEERKVVLVEIRELRVDVRESYKANRDNRSSPRLEAPPPPLPLPAVLADGGR